MSIIDFHTHVYPLPDLPDKVMELRRKVRHLIAPLSRTNHMLHSKTRKLPEKVRALIDEVGTVSMLPHLLIESGEVDHREEMARNGVDRAVVVAFPPLISNSFVLDLAARSDSRVIPAVALRRDESEIEAKLEHYLERGAKILKIHPIYDSLGPDSDSYKRQIAMAAKHKMLVILHTGVIRSRLAFPKATELGSVDRYAHWFEQYPELHFCLAHMGFHETNEVLETAKRFPNTSLLASWQPEESIAEAVNALGAERVLYASDWPLLGSNMEVAIQRIQVVYRQGALNTVGLENVLGGNAERLLKNHGII